MRARIFTIAVCLALLPGCTVVRIVHGDAIDVHHSIGLVRVEISPKAGPTYVETNNVGALLGDRRASLGWTKEATVVFPQGGRCAVFIVATSVKVEQALAAELKNQGESLSSICLAGGISNEANIQ
jgi:hypothetical protein